MAIKKSQLYSALWEGCNALRGGMDASQYKDYVLTMLFWKYISDKQKSDPKALFFKIPADCTFDDIVKLKHKDGIGDMLNKKLEEIGKASYLGASFFYESNFNDPKKLGSGKDLIDTVSGLIEVFENPDLDFGNNRAADDDLIGDAYEYLMRKFAQASGKSKGQFYTPAEASRLAAKLLDIKSDTKSKIEIYDMTCGSGSLLLRAANESQAKGTWLYGQEIDIATLHMAQMNMILHGMMSNLQDGDTINNPRHKDPNNASELMRFDYCVANPPYSVKGWRKSAKENDEFGRWNTGVIGLPPESKGDYAFLLHMVRSMKSTGKGSCFLPHGVLFRGSLKQNENGHWEGDGEAMVRKYLVDQHLISGIIGLPANIFYGTGIPTCILVIDKNAAHSSQGIFMIDAKEGFRKDGDKNRLREQDIRRICDVWESKSEVEHYSRLVTWNEIKDNAYNLNIPRYIQPEDKEPKHDLFAHLNGGIPQSDVDSMTTLWDICTTLKTDLFMPSENKGYLQFTLKATADMDGTINANGSYQAQKKEYFDAINCWEQRMRDELANVCPDCAPKQLIESWGNDILNLFNECKSLVDGYDVYDELRQYWDEVLQDDVYMVSRDGWKLTYAPTELPLDKKGNVKGNFTFEDVVCDLLPSSVVVETCFSKEYAEIKKAESEIETVSGEIAAMLENDEYSDAFEAIADKDGAIKPAYAKAKVKEAKKTPAAFDKEFVKVWKDYSDLNDKLDEQKKDLKAKNVALATAVHAKYPTFTEDDVREMVFKHKWMPAMRARLDALMQAAQQSVAASLHSLNDRYAYTLTDIKAQVTELEEVVMSHLNEMGY